MKWDHLYTVPAATVCWALTRCQGLTKCFIYDALCNFTTTLWSWIFGLWLATWEAVSTWELSLHGFAFTETWCWVGCARWLPWAPTCSDAGLDPPGAASAPFSHWRRYHHYRAKCFSQWALPVGVFFSLDPKNLCSPLQSQSQRMLVGEKAKRIFKKCIKF